MYSIKDVMLMFGIGERTVRRYLSDGIITGNKVGGIWRFSEEDIKSFFTEKQVRNKMKTEVHKLLYDFLNTPNPQKKESHCFSMIDVRLTNKENKELQKIIFAMIRKYTDLQMKYYYEDGNYRYVFVGNLDFVEKMTISINDFKKSSY